MYFITVALKLHATVVSASCLHHHVVPKRIGLPFELDSRRRTDELVIIATRLNLLGKRACPSDTLPVL